MDTYALQREILKLNLMPAEKLVGMALALRMDKKTQAIRVQQRTIAEDCGFSVRTVRRAIRSLVEASVFRSVRKKKASVLIPVLEIKSGIERARTPMSYLDGTPVSSLKRKKKECRMPWDYDLAHSTKVEEEEKRSLYQVESA